MIGHPKHREYYFLTYNYTSSISFLGKSQPIQIINKARNISVVLKHVPQTKFEANRSYGFMSYDIQHPKKQIEFTTFICNT